MFASPLPTTPDRPAVVVQKERGQEASVHLPALSEAHGSQKGDERKQQHFAHLMRPYAYSNSDNNGCRQPSVDSDSVRLNLTLSPKAFASGVEGQQSKLNKGSHANFESFQNSTQAENRTHTHRQNSPDIPSASGLPNPKDPFQQLPNMEPYSYRNTGSSSIEPVFADASFTRDDYQRRLPASNSCRVLLSDGTSYPSLIFPNVVADSRGGVSFDSVQRHDDVQQHGHRSTNTYLTSGTYGATHEGGVHNMDVNPETHSSPIGSNYYTYYRRQIPASPIIADTTLVGDDRVPAVSIPQERDDVIDKDHARHTSASFDSKANATDHEAITSLSQETQLVQGVIGLPLKSSSSPECNRFSSGNVQPFSSRLLTAKRKLLARPIQLIHVNKWDGKEVLTIDDNARQMLGDLSTQHVAVICICGELQTGKSALANLLMDDNVMESNTGFNVGALSAAARVSHGSRFCQRAESEGTTEGVWMSAVEAEGEKENLLYLILDFEGLGCKRKSVEHDQRLFTLALLVAHYVVFVTRGVVDGDTIFSLASASAWTHRLARTHTSSVPLKPSTSSGIIPQSPQAANKAEAPSTPKQAGPTSSSFGGWRPPVLLWVLQDFNMSLVDPQNNPVTAGDYLEALLSCAGSSSTTPDSDIASHLELPQIRSARQEVSDLFPERDCIALPSPLGYYVSNTSAEAASKSSDRSLRSVSVTEMIPLYQRRLTQLRIRVFRECKAKAIDETALTGPALVTIIDKLVEGINKGDVPESLRLLGSLQHDECRRLKHLCESSFTKDLRDQFKEKLPVSTRELTQGAEELQRKYTQHFKANAIGDEDVLRQYKTQLKDKLRRITEKAIEENDKHADLKCRQRAKLLSEKLGIDEKINEKLYIDLQALHDDISVLREEYNKDLRGPQHIHQRVLNDFIDQLLCRGGKAVADALKDLTRDSERTVALLHQKTMDAERKEEEASRLEQALQEQEVKAEILIRDLEEAQREVEKLRGEVAEKDAANQRLHAMHSSRLIESDGDNGFGYGRRQRYSAVGMSDTSRCFGHKCILM